MAGAERDLNTMARKKVDQAIKAIKETRGLAVRVAEACGIARNAVYQWERVPVERVHTVAPILEMTPEQIRPDIFRVPA
jgi:sorbitol-specific phosphotransferase system component IIBC